MKLPSIVSMLDGTIPRFKRAGAQREGFARNHTLWLYTVVPKLHRAKSNFIGCHFEVYRPRTKHNCRT